MAVNGILLGAGGNTPLVIDSSSIKNVEAMNAAIQLINNTYEHREILLRSDNVPYGKEGIFHLFHTSTDIVIFIYIDGGKIISADLIMDANAISYGRIPLTVLRQTITLSSTGWTASGNVFTQAVRVQNVNASEAKQEIHVTPATASMSAYMESGVYASAQAANQITFTASKVPTANLTVYTLVKEL